MATLIPAEWTAAEVLEHVRHLRPDENPVAAQHDDMARHCYAGEPWFVWFDSEDTEPERIVLPVLR